MYVRAPFQSIVSVIPCQFIQTMLPSKIVFFHIFTPCSIEWNMITVKILSLNSKRFRKYAHSKIGPILVTRDIVPRAHESENVNKICSLYGKIMKIGICKFLGWGIHFWTWKRQKVMDFLNRLELSDKILTVIIFHWLEHGVKIWKKYIYLRVTFKKIFGWFDTELLVSHFNTKLDNSCN